MQTKNGGGAFSDLEVVARYGFCRKEAKDQRSKGDGGLKGIEGAGSCLFVRSTA